MKNNMNNKKKITIGAVILILLGLFGFSRTETPSIRTGSAVDGNNYIATSTGTLAPMRGSNSNSSNDVTLLKNGPGSIGQIVVNTAGAAAPAMEFYDATTTNITLRDAAQSTTTIFKFSLPNALAAGTYTFDAEFSRGIIVVTRAGSAQASTTILYR